jgi:hypothetical protein
VQALADRCETAEIVVCVEELMGAREFIALEEADLEAVQAALLFRRE